MLDIEIDHSTVPDWFLSARDAALLIRTPRPKKKSLALLLARVCVRAVCHATNTAVTVGILAARRKEIQSLWTRAGNAFSCREPKAEFQASERARARDNPRRENNYKVTREYGRREREMTVNNDNHAERRVVRRFQWRRNIVQDYSLARGGPDWRWSKLDKGAPPERIFRSESRCRGAGQPVPARVGVFARAARSLSFLTSHRDVIQ